MSLSDRAYSEKRDFIRMRLETPVILEHDGQSIDALCVDLSSTGMQLEARTHLALGAKVEVKVPSDHGQLRGLHAQGEVVRVIDLADGLQSLGLAISSMG